MGYMQTAALAPARCGRNRKVSLHEAKPQSEAPEPTPRSDRCSRCERLHDGDARPSGWRREEFETGAGGQIRKTDDSDVENPDGVTGFRYLPGCPAAAFRPPRQACSGFLDFKDEVAVAKARVRLAKVRAEFGLTYPPSPPSLADRAAVFMAEEKARAEKRKKARAGVAAAKARARAYLGPELVP